MFVAVVLRSFGVRVVLLVVLFSTIFCSIGGCDGVPVKMALKAIEACDGVLLQRIVSENKGVLEEVVGDSAVALVGVSRRCADNGVVAVIMNNIKNSSIVGSGGETLLHVAIKKQSDAVVKSALQMHPSLLNVVDHFGRSPMVYAVLSGDVKVLKLLVRLGADVSLADVDGLTPLLYASKYSNREMVDILLKNGAKPNEVDHFGRNALMYASWSGDLYLVKKFTSPDSGIDIDAMDFEGNRAIFSATSCYTEHKVLKYLMQTGAKIDYANNSDESPMEHFINCNDNQSFLTAMHYNPNLNIKKANGATLLMIATNPNLNASINGSGEKRYGLFFVNALLRKKLFINQYDNLGNTVLMYAVRFGKVGELKSILAKKPDLNRQNSDGETALMIAIKDKNVQFAKDLMRLGADVNLVDKDGFSAMSYAVPWMNSEILNWLIDRLKNVDAVSKSEETAIFVAARKNDVKMLNRLIHKGANVNKTNSDGETVLVVAAKNKSYNVLNFFINNKFASESLVSARDRFGLNLLMILAKNMASFSMIRYFTDLSPDSLNAQNSDGVTPLMFAISSRRKDVIDYFVRHGVASLSLKDSSGANALMFAVKERLPSVVSLLLKKNISVNEVNGFGQTALMIAIESGDLESSKLLIQCPGVDPYTSDLSGQNVLVLAVKKGVHPTIQLLLNSFSFPDNKDETVSVAMDVADNEIIKMLLEYGFEVDFVYKNGLVTPLMYFVEAGRLDIVKTILDSKPQSLDWRSENGDTALIMAVKQGNVAMAKLLIEAGADITFVNGDNENPIQIALNKKDKGMINFLRDQVRI